MSNQQQEEGLKRVVGVSGVFINVINNTIPLAAEFFYYRPSLPASWVMQAYLLTSHVDCCSYLSCFAMLK